MKLPEIQTQRGFIRLLLNNVLFKGADKADKGETFSCQFLAVVLNSPLLLTHIADATHGFLNSNFSCNVFFFKWQNYLCKKWKFGIHHTF